MRRRQLLTALGIAAFGGCASDSNGRPPQNSPTNTTTPTDQSASTTAAGPVSLSRGETHTLHDTVELSVEATRLATNLEFETRLPMEATDDTMFLLVAVRAENTSENITSFPGRGTFGVLADGVARDPITVSDESAQRDHALSAPVTGSLYTGLDRAHVGVERRGWLLFEVPETTTEPRVAWLPDTWERVRPAYWETHVDTSVLPDVSVVNLSNPEQVANDEAVSASLTLANEGGRNGTVNRTLSATQRATGKSWEKQVRTTVPAGETVTVEWSISPEVAKNVTVSTPGIESHHVEVVRARRAYGESFQTDDSVDVSVDFVTLTDEISYESGGTEVTSEDYTLAIHRVAVRNPTEKSVDIPSGHRFESVVGAFRDRTTISWKSRSVASPDLGTMYAPRMNAELHPGAEHSGVIAHEVPADATPEDVAIHGFFATGWDTDQHCTWVHESRLSDER